MVKRQISSDADVQEAYEQSKDMLEFEVRLTELKKKREVKEPSLDALLDAKEFNQDQNVQLEAKIVKYRDELVKMQQYLDAIDTKYLKNYVKMGLPSNTYEDITKTVKDIRNGISYVLRDERYKTRSAKTEVLGGAAGGAAVMAVGTFFSGGLLAIVALPAGAFGVPLVRQQYHYLRQKKSHASYENLDSNVQHLDAVASQTLHFVDDNITPRLQAATTMYQKDEEKIQREYACASLCLEKCKSISPIYNGLKTLAKEIGASIEQSTE